MMEALSQVYEQPEDISENQEGFINGGGNAAMQKYIKMGMSPSQARIRVETDGMRYSRSAREKERETERINRDRTIQQAGGGDAAEKARIAYRKANPEPSTILDPNPSSDDVVNARYNTRVQGRAALTKLGGGDLDKGIEIYRKQQADKAAKLAADKERPSGGGGGGGGGERPSGNNTSTPAPKPKPTQTYTINGKTYSSKAEINKEYDRLRKSGGDAKAFGNAVFKATNRPATATTPGGTKFERRTPTSAELRAAQAARAAGKGEEGAIKASVNAGRTNTSSGSVKQEISAVKSRMSANQQTSVNNAVNSGVKKVGVKVGNTVKTKVNPDSSMSVTQGRSADATKKIKQGLDIQSADLFDIVKGEFINEGYSEEDTMYMMANLNEEQLQEFLGQLARVAIKNVNKIPGVKGVVSKVGRMFGRSPKPTRIPAGDIGAMRLRQGQATDAVNRLNQSTAASKAKDAARAATREKTRLNNLDPRTVSNNNARDAARQVRQSNVDMGRPSWYDPNNPGSKEALRRYNADKRSGIRGLPE